MLKPGQTTNTMGFGYDQVSDDYKIVTIIDRKTFIYPFKKTILKRKRATRYFSWLQI